MYSQETKKLRKRDRGYYKKKVDDEWFFWRPIVYNILTFAEASEGEPGLLLEANFALDKKIKEQKKGVKK